MIKPSPGAVQTLTVGVDDCRVRLQTGQPLLLVDARLARDWEASAIRAQGAVRLRPEQTPFRVPCPKHNFLVVYCA